MSSFFNFIKFIFGARAIDKFAYDMANILVLEVGFEKLIREAPETMTSEHFKVLKMTDTIEARKAWDYARVNKVSERYGDKRLDTFRNDLATLITKFINK